jgi:hypothetical protein
MVCCDQRAAGVGLSGSCGAGDGLGLAMDDNALGVTYGIPINWDRAASRPMA